MTNLTTVAKEVSTGSELVARILPFIAGLIPEATPFEPLIEGLLAAIDNGAKAVAQANPGASFTDVLSTLVSHNTPGQPNSSALS